MAPAGPLPGNGVIMAVQQVLMSARRLLWKTNGWVLDTMAAVSAAAAATAAACSPSRWRRSCRAAEAPAEKISVTRHTQEHLFLMSSCHLVFR